jgi:hypothetical protein
MEWDGLAKIGGVAGIYAFHETAAVGWALIAPVPVMFALPMSGGIPVPVP